MWNNMSKLLWLLVIITCNFGVSSNKNDNLSQKQTSGNLFDCPNESDQNSNVLACPSSKTEENQGFNKCDVFLSVELLGVLIQICIESEQLLLPNASITYVSKYTQSYPLNHNKVFNIKSYFTGSIIIFKWPYPFNGELLSGNLIGKSLLNGTIFVLKCSGFTITQVNRNKCYECQAFCPQLDTNGKPDSEISFDFDFLFEESTLSKKDVYGTRIYQKLKLNQLSDTNSPKMTCSLHLVSDHLFFKYVAKMDLTKAINTMLGLVNKVNAIFRKNFNIHKGHNELKFAIRHITVIQNENSQNYKLGTAYLTSDEYLKKFSLYNFNTVCLAVGLTFRNFGVVVGKAFPANWPSINVPGGICEERMKINSHHVSYNTLIMSFFHIQEKLSDTTLALRLAHELGHSLGASHDETEECLPGDVTGNYIMSAALNKGNKPNHYLFSPCSMESMMPVIINKGQCLFAMDTTPLCGNSIPEHGEECDCGQAHQCEEIDPCCNPDGDMFHRPCSVKTHKRKQCSPKVSPCCNDLCIFVSSSSNPQCDPVYLRNRSGLNCNTHHCP